MTSKRYCVYSADTGRTVEGGFFSRFAAEDSAEAWTAETGSKHYAASQHDRDRAERRADQAAADRENVAVTMRRDAIRDRQ